jgi:hypothetical protein
LAVIGAVAMVLLAIVVRGALDDDGGSDGPNRSEDGEIVLVCALDLAEACRALDGVTVIEEEAAATATAIGQATAELDGVDGWITTSAWVEVVDSRAPDRLGDATTLASSPVIVAVDPARSDAVQSLCEGLGVWYCLGNNAGAEWGALGQGGQSSWGALKTGLPSADTAVGLSVIASATTEFFGNADFASNDFETTDFAGWLAGLTEPSGTGERSPIAALVTARGKYTAVGDVSAAVGARAVDIAEATTVDATIVAVGLPGGDRLPDLAPLRDALVEAGWNSTPGGPPQPTFKPGVMAALHTLWTEVTR